MQFALFHAIGQAARQRRVEILPRFLGVAAGKGGIAGLPPKARALHDLAAALGFLRRLFEGDDRRPPALRPRQSKAHAVAGVEAAAVDPPILGESDCLVRRFQRLVEAGLERPGKFGRDRDAAVGVGRRSRGRGLLH